MPPPPTRHADGSPPAPIIHIVLLYSATLAVPSLTPMEFRATARGTEVALGSRYGVGTAETYFKSFAAESAGEEYLVYFNTSARLPRNIALGALFGRPGPAARPVFRGDVIVIAALTEHLLDPGGLSFARTIPHRTYVDFPEFKVAFADECMLRWYRSTGWADMNFKDRPYNELSTHVSGFGEKERASRRGSTERADRLHPGPRNRLCAPRPNTTPDDTTPPTTARQEHPDRCAQCGLAALPARSLCGGCHITHYCSPGCQAAHWPEHKQQCHISELFPEGRRAAQ
ncbi:hypothetical protein B0H17DRAFT_1089118 [Mycena rosella]|uniref:MYND-type domain-containing protein n=1 Tax=Mycena rosella TaxID=1033263 RepID=A0AAD7CWV8_MYCRO|nr:hypothetical protein B0H17DRAFT_1089118 [Mycena rosella]